MEAEITGVLMEAGVDVEFSALDAAQWMWEQGVRSPEDVATFLAILHRCRVEYTGADPCPPAPDPSRPQYTPGPLGSDDPNAPPHPQTILPDPQPGDPPPVGGITG